MPDCLSRLITRSSPPDENELHRLKTALQTDDVKVKAGSEDALDNKARTELETSVEEKTAEVAAWKQKQSQSAEWQYANCWTSVYAKLFDRLTPEEVLTVGGACDEGVYTVEVADSTGPGQCKPGRCAAVPSAVPSA